MELFLDPITKNTNMAIEDLLTRCGGTSRGVACCLVPSKNIAPMFEMLNDPSQIDLVPTKVKLKHLVITLFFGSNQ